MKALRRDGGGGERMVKREKRKKTAFPRRPGLKHSINSLPRSIFRLLKKRLSIEGEGMIEEVKG